MKKILILIAIFIVVNLVLMGILMGLMTWEHDYVADYAKDEITASLTDETDKKIARSIVDDYHQDAFQVASSDFKNGVIPFTINKEEYLEFQKGKVKLELNEMKSDSVAEKNLFGLWIKITEGKVYTFVRFNQNKTADWLKKAINTDARGSSHSRSEKWVLNGDIITWGLDEKIVKLTKKHLIIKISDGRLSHYRKADWQAESIFDKYFKK